MEIILSEFDHAKLLTVTVSSNHGNLTCNRHVNTLTPTVGKMHYMLYHFIRAGVSKEDRTRIYLSVIRPSPEYVCAVWHTGLPQHMTDHIGMVQKRAPLSTQVIITTTY